MKSATLPPGENARLDGVRGRGGYWLVGQVRALSPERGGATPAAALTACAGPEHRASVLRAGFQSHVAKPVEVRDLVEVVAGLARKE
jgi:CheY-like chemotaxis protein